VAQSDRPWWDRALDPLRHEASMFHVLIAVIVAAAVLVAIVEILRAIFLHLQDRTDGAVPARPLPALRAERWTWWRSVRRALGGRVRWPGQRGKG
jgi:hypothetical protein